MHPRIRQAKALGPFRLALEFTDGSNRTVDLTTLLSGRAGVLRELSDPAVFAKVSVDPEAGTVVWPNGADIDPDVLFELASSAG
jgi:Protein of unknown function (DUF2442)